MIELRVDAPRSPVTLLARQESLLFNQLAHLGARWHV